MVFNMNFRQYLTQVFLFSLLVAGLLIISLFTDPAEAATQGQGTPQVTLLENPPCLIDCYAVYQVCNLKNADTVLNSDSFNVFYRTKKDTQLKTDIPDLKDKKIQIQQSITKYRDIPTYTTTLKSRIENRTDNVTGQKTTTTTYYNETIQTGTTQQPYTAIEYNQYAPDTKILKKGSCETIRIDAKKKPFEAVDHVMFFDDKAYTEYAWWNATFAKKKAIQINNTDNAISNYTILLNVTYDSDMAANWADIRFTNTTENEELNYWIAANVTGLYADVYVRYPYSLTNTTNTTIYMYYGNSTAVTSKSNGFNTFQLYDDFNDGDYITNRIWTINTGSTWSATGGTLKQSDGTWNSIYTNSTLTYGVFEWDAKVKNTPDGNVQFAFISDNSAVDKGFSVYPNHVADVNLFLNAVSIGTTTIIDDGLFHKYKVIRNSTNWFKYYIDGTLKVTLNNAGIQTGGLYAVYRTYEPQDEIDNIRFSHYLGNVPIYSFGTETNNVGTPPLISIESPTPNTNYNTQTIWFNVTTNADVSTCIYSLDGAANDTMTLETTKRATKQKISMTIQTHNVQFWCNSTLGTWNNTEILNFEVVRGQTLNIYDETDKTTPIYANISVSNTTTTITFTNTTTAAILSTNITGSITMTIGDYLGLYQQRIFYDTMTQDIRSRNVYLLKTTSGHQVDIYAKDGLNIGIENTHINVARQYGYVYTNVTECYTDSVGYCPMWLNDTATYKFSATATGYDTATSYITPTLTTYTITLNSPPTDIEVIGELTGVSLDLIPYDNSLKEKGAQLFNFSVTSNKTLDIFGMNITYMNYTGILLFSGSSTAANGGSIAATINTTGRNGTINVKTYIQRDGYALRSYYQNYTIYSIEDYGNFSLSTLITGLNANQFGTFGSFAIGFIILLCVVGAVIVTGATGVGMAFIAVIGVGFMATLGVISINYLILIGLVIISIIVLRR